MTTGWFRVREVAEGIWLLAEPPFTSSYLIRGRNRAILFDTGLGFRDIRDPVGRLVDVPVLVVNSHHHFDHVGSNHGFEDIAIHEAGADALRAGPPEEWLRDFARGVRSALEQFAVYRELDDGFFRLLLPENIAAPLPDSFDLDAWTVRPSVPSRLLRDGEVIDLGGRSVTVVHTPGHTTDSICLFDPRTGSLLAGDTVSHAPIYTHLPTGDVGDLLRSAERLASEYGGGTRAIFVHHVLRYEVKPDLLRDIAEACTAILDGSAEPGLGFDLFGRRVVLYRFPRTGIVTGLADEAGPDHPRA